MNQVSNSEIAESIIKMFRNRESSTCDHCERRYDDSVCDKCLAQRLWIATKKALDLKDEAHAKQLSLAVGALEKIGDKEDKYFMELELSNEQSFFEAQAIACEALKSLREKS